MKRQPKEIQITEENGRQVYNIPLGKSGNTAKIYKEDWEMLQRLGVGQTWNDVVQGYVSASKPIRISRVLLNAAEGQMVRYVDGDRSNLRRENLVLMKDVRKRREDKDWFAKGN